MKHFFLQKNDTLPNVLNNVKYFKLIDLNNKNFCLGLFGEEKDPIFQMLYDKYPLSSPITSTSLQSSSVSTSLKLFLS